MTTLVSYADKAGNNKAMECYKKTIEVNADFAEVFYNVGNATLPRKI